MSFDEMEVKVKRSLKEYDEANQSDSEKQELRENCVNAVEEYINALNNDPALRPAYRAHNPNSVQAAADRKSYLEGRLKWAMAVKQRLNDESS